MNRWLTAMRWDVVRQFRSGFYYASGFFVLVWAAVLMPLPAGTLNLPLLLPPVLAINLVAVSFYYISALVLLEKGEGSLAAVAVSPLRTGEYLGSKAATLTLLGMAESGLLVGLIYGLGVRPWLLVGLGLLCALYALLGFAAVARYDAINSYLLPSIGYVIGLTLPLVGYFGFWHSPLFWLHPIQPALTLLAGGWRPLAPWEIGYGLGAGVAWCAVAYGLAARAFRKFVVRTAGG